jgi:hypothetical protein
MSVEHLDNDLLGKIHHKGMSRALLKIVIAAAAG